MKTHHDLEVWKQSISLVTEIYECTKKYPQIEQYGLTNQIRLSAVSVPSNIAEGVGRSSTKEFAHFLSIALGSLTELETQLIISKNLLFLEKDTFEHLMEQIIAIRKMIVGLKKSILK